VRQEKFRKACVQKPVRKRILIISEGKKTEPNYFNSLKQQYRLSSVDIKDTKKNTGKELLVIAIDLFKISKAEKNEYDEIWIVLDRDGYTKHPQVFDRLKHYPKIKIAFSSPCFEYWLLLHFEYTSAPFNDCNDAIKKLSQYLPEYEKGRDNSGLLLPTIDDAISNSKKIVKHHEETSNQNIWEFNPFTDLHILVEKLINLNETIT
jgi:RloB-like protein